IISPHTSAGRVPTTQGIRFFVDSLLSVHSLDTSTAQKVAEKFEDIANTESLIAKTSSVLSELTHMVGVVTLPKREAQILRHIEFLPLADNRVLVILVLNERDVQNRIIETEQEYTLSELTQVGNFLTHHFGGKDLSKARGELLRELNRDRTQLDTLMK